MRLKWFASLTGGRNYDPAACVRVTRTNSTFTSYSSLDCVRWKVIKPKSVTMNTNVFIGIAVSSKSTSRLNASTFDRVTVSP